MRLDRCMRLFALIVLLLSIDSALITALIVSSDTLNIVQDVSNQQKNNVPMHEIPTENDKNIEQVISESKTETINTDSNVNSNSNPDANTNNKVINSDNVAENSNLELMLEKEQMLESKVIIESQIGATDEETDTNYVEDSIEIDENVNDDNASPSVPATSTITTGEGTKELFVETPLVERIESVVVVNNASNETQPQQLNATDIPTVNIASENEASKDSLESTPVEKNSTEENKNDSTIATAAAPIELNLTVEENQIPVFSEWAQKRMEEVEKADEQDIVNTSTMKKNLSSPNKPQVLKLKSAKNYASPDCGAKIIAANTESSGTGYVLTLTKDEYMLSPCKSRIWFVVELCEAIQAERIDLANFELFSSSPKNFSVGVSNRFPTRDWTNVGKFIAKDERYIQNFDLYPHLFGKYVRVDIHSHYNSEHFCPISLFRVYGTSEFEAFETENRQHPIDDLDDDDEDELESETNKSKGNIFQSASDAVMSIVDTVKKAVSVVKPNKTSDSSADNSLNEHHGNCITVNYPINCEKCSEKMAKEVNAISECKQQLLNRLLSIAIVRNSLYKSHICSNLIGFDLNINCSDAMGDGDNTTSKQLTDLQIEYITHLFSLKYITAMCNLLAVNDRNYVRNSTIPLNPEPMINVTIDKNANDILPETKKKPHTKTTTADSIPKLSKGPSENKENEAGGMKPLTQAEELTVHIDNVKSSEQNRNSENHGNIDAKSIPSSSGENIDAALAEKLDQNIFNVAEPVENVVEQQQVELPTTQNEQATTPNVIILPEPTTTPTPTPNPTDINEANDDQGTNGWTNTQQFGQKLHSESVFFRLSNRVKALERNMSLSGQYLEELSRGYKKHIEELQSSFAKTLLNIEEQSRKNIERKQELIEQNELLRNELDILSERMFSWKNILIACACFTCVQVIIFHIILIIWGRKYGLERSPSIDVNAMIENVDIAPRRRKSGNVPVKFRRKSAEEKRERTISESSAQALQRRPSTEALNIMGTYTELLIDDSNSSKNDSPKIKPHDEDFTGYVRIEDLRNMYEKPENDYEFYGPASELKSNRSSSPDNDGCGSVTALDSLLDNSSPKRTKSIKNSKYKNRRLSSPSFFKSPFSSSLAAQSTGWEWHRSKKSSKSSQKDTNTKSKSESPPSTNQNGLNNNSSKMPPDRRKSFGGDQQINDDSTLSSISSTFDNNDRKTTGSFKRLLKKIF